MKEEENHLNPLLWVEMQVELRRSIETLTECLPEMLIVNKRSEIRFSTGNGPEYGG